MKNVHVIPTDKPSRLFKDQDNILNVHGIGDKQHIYITNNEVKKHGDWVVSNLNEVTRFRSLYCQNEYRKIILTTDQDLIADGVQAIDDALYDGFIAGAKWQAERMYSEEEVLNLWDWLNDGFMLRRSLPSREELISWFEQFRKSKMKEKLKQEMAGKAFYESANRLIVVKRQEKLKDIELEKVFGSSHCEFSVIENNLAKLYRNQEKILKAIKLLRNDD
jgi:hypothetical protein